MTRFESAEELFEDLGEVRERLRAEYGDAGLAAIARAVSETLRTLPAEDQRRVLLYARSLARTTPPGTSGEALLEHAGALAVADADEMSRVIEEDCERVNPDGW